MNPQEQAQFQAITQKYGYTPPAAGGAAPSGGSDWFTATAPRPPASTATPYTKRVSTAMGQGADMAGNAFANAGDELMQHTGAALDEAGKEGIGGHILTGLKEAGNWAGTIAKGTLGAATGVARAAAAPVTELATKNPAGDTFDKTLGERVSEPIAHGAEQVADFAKAHPEVTDWWTKLDPSIQQGLLNVVNTVGLTGLGKVASAPVKVGDTVDALKTVATDIKTGAGKVVEGVKSATTDVTGKAKTFGSVVAHPIETFKNAVYGPSVAAQAAKGDKALETALEITSPFRYKKESIASMENAGKPGGAVKSGMFAPYKAVPTEKDIAVANSVKTLVKDGDPLDNIANINEGIENRSLALTSHFSNNRVPFNFEDVQDFFKGLKPSTSLKADPAAYSTYGRVREELVGTIYNFLKSNAKNSREYGSSMSMDEVWNARKAVDHQIERELNAATFESPQYVGVRAAAQDFRDGLNEFLVNNIGNPGEMEKINRMRESLAALRERGIEVPDGPDAMNILRQQLGIKTSEEEAAARSAYFLDSMDNLNNMYIARGNIAESNWRLLDKNFIDRWMKQNPNRARLVKYIGLGTIGGATGLILHQ